MLQLKQEMSCGQGRLRIDVHGPKPLDRIVEDMTFLDYRLANVKIAPEITRQAPDIIWRQESSRKDVQYENQTLMLSGAWEAGELQKILVSMLALRIEDAGLHAFHASAIRYRDRTVMFLGGESNSGKSFIVSFSSRLLGLEACSPTRQISLFMVSSIHAFSLWLSAAKALS